MHWKKSRSRLAQGLDESAIIRAVPAISGRMKAPVGGPTFRLHSSLSFSWRR